MSSTKPPGGKNALTIEDLVAVLTELYPVRGRWYNIGLQLQLSVADLQRIESEYKHDHGTCLRQMLIKWLETGKASWKSLCEALKCPIVLEDEKQTLVTELKEKYCQTQTSTKDKKRQASDPATGAAATKASKHHTTIAMSLL